MRVGAREAVLFEDRATQFVVEPYHLVQQLRVLNVVTLLVAVVGQRASYHLLVCDVLEVDELVLVLPLIVVEALSRV